MKTRLKYVKAFPDRYGKIRSYYRRGGEQRRIDGPYGSPEWLACYTRIHTSFEAAGKSPRRHDTLGFAIQLYMKSARFENLSFNSKKNYRAALADLDARVGDRKLESFTRGVLVQIRDKIALESPTKAALRVKMMRAAFETAADHDLITVNPALGVKPPSNMKHTPHRKWTDAEIDLIKTSARPHIRRAMMVLLHTGLRCSDALELKRSIIKNGRIDLTTEKTGAVVSIPIHPDLAAELERPLPVESIYMIPGARGRKITRHALLAMFKREFESLGADEPPVTHGLRKNAVVAMLEIGAPPDVIAAVTGQSFKMIQHYGQEYDRSKRSSELAKLWRKSE